MKRINLVKYGFVKCPEESFWDDGSHFDAYRVGRVRVTKCISDGQAYIDGRIDEGFLEFAEYRKLPHYSAISKLNGVSVSTLTELDLMRLYEACVEYEREYIEEENRIKASLPTEEEIRERCSEILALRLTEIHMIDKRLATLTPALLVKCSDYQWKQIREFYQTLVRKSNQYNVDTYPKTIVGKPMSRKFMDPNFGDLKPTFYFKELMEIFDKYENK